MIGVCGHLVRLCRASRCSSLRSRQRVSTVVRRACDHSGGATPAVRFDRFLRRSHGVSHRDQRPSRESVWSTDAKAVSTGTSPCRQTGLVAASRSRTTSKGGDCRVVVRSVGHPSLVAPSCLISPPVPRCRRDVLGVEPAATCTCASGHNETTAVHGKSGERDSRLRPPADAHVALGLQHRVSIDPDAFLPRGRRPSRTC